MYTKLTYSTPEVEIIEIKLEKNVLTLSQYGEDGSAGPEQQYNNYGTDY